ncbi:MAG: FlgD immunoglobulin-like domain containing protein [Gemmatimonadota bacterium]|jgi:hypothetical protein|nr:hypothetical protein [Gemmatimonadota bacterium]MDP6461323.1 FlgD immunoglobulin-like domain containing protein [Gemmatimonadota bacterium]MDP6528853.1 FlgD immunoglobulin-like domain containing protein [Gemmatimonadota bacterium]MDP6802407.1 FlgD immunoglobulin-like domain containing protein [Gemmatimonadota bacterium]MDP7031078.1 FlgD immunoglobulin-like domain containing protein [Gemmatimonadota bacterium]
MHASRWLRLAVLLVLAFPAPSLPVNTCPIRNEAFFLDPFQDQFGADTDPFELRLALEAEGYRAWEPPGEEEHWAADSVATSTPSVNLRKLIEALGNSGILKISTHGELDKMLLEHTCGIPESAMEATVANYRTTYGFAHNEIGYLPDPSDWGTTDCYTLWVTGDVVAWFAVDHHTYFHNASCWSTSYANKLPYEVVGGHTLPVNNPDAVMVIREVFDGLLGRRTLEDRNLQNTWNWNTVLPSSYGPGYFRLNSSTDLEVTPHVTDYHPPSGAVLDTATVAGWVEFSARMDISWPGRVIDGSARVHIDRVKWVSDHRIEFDIHPVDTGSVVIRVDASDTHPLWNDELSLNGDGAPPGKDDFEWLLYSTVSASNTACAFESAHAWRDPKTGNVRLGFVTDREWGSSAFSILDAKSEHPLVRIPAEGGERPHFYEVALPEPGSGEYIVREHPGDGSAPDRTRPIRLAETPPMLSSLRNLNDAAASWGPYPPGRDPSPAVFPRVSSGSAARIVFYSSRGDFMDALGPEIDWYESQGLSCTKVIGSSDPDDARAAAQSAWAAAGGASAEHLPVFVIVGEANEGSVPEYDIVGTYYPTDDPGGESYWGTASDALIVDFDGDEIPDTPWMRIQGHTVEQVTHGVQSALDYLHGDWISPDRVLQIVGDMTGCSPASDGEPAGTMAGIAASYGAEGIPVDTILDSDFIDCGDYAARRQAVAAAINAGVTSLQVMANVSNRSNFGFLLQKVFGGTAAYFTMADVPVRQRIVVEAPGCGMGDTDRNNPSYYPSYAWDFQTADPALGTTAVVWFSHKRGGLKPRHLDLARRYHELRLHDDSWILWPELFFRAVREMALDTPEAVKWLRYAAAEGHPVIRPELRGASTSVRPGGAAGPLGPFGLGIAPNPTAGETAVLFALARGQEISARIHDVGGRLVRTLATPHHREAGEHALVWDGHDHAGGPVASGVYFVRVTGEGGTAVAKVIMTR